MGRYEENGVDTKSTVLPGVETKRITVPVGAKIAGKSLRALDLRYRHGVTVLSVTRGAKTTSNPKCDFTIMELDELLVMGDKKDINKLGSILKSK